MRPRRTPETHARTSHDHVTSHYLDNRLFLSSFPPPFYDHLTRFGHTRYRPYERVPPLPQAPIRPVIEAEEDKLYPAHFRKGSIIELANGKLKKIEDLREEDFRSCADLSTQYTVDSSTLLKIERPSATSSVVTLKFGVGKSRIEVCVEFFI